MSESKEREKALKMRDKAMRTWGKTKKDADHSDSDESDEKCVTTPRRKRQRRRGSDALKYLEENAHREAELKKEELAFRKEQAELENNKAGTATRAGTATNATDAATSRLTKPTV